MIKKRKVKKYKHLVTIFCEDTRIINKSYLSKKCIPTINEYNKFAKDIESEFSKDWIVINHSTFSY